MLPDRTRGLYPAERGQIASARQHVPRDPVPLAVAGVACAHREDMAQVVQPQALRARIADHPGQASAPDRARRTGISGCSRQYGYFGPRADIRQGLLGPQAPEGTGEWNRVSGISTARSMASHLTPAKRLRAGPSNVVRATGWSTRGGRTWPAAGLLGQDLWLRRSLRFIDRLQRVKGTKPVRLGLSLGLPYVVPDVVRRFAHLFLFYFHDVTSRTGFKERSARTTPCNALTCQSSNA